ncbi:MAG TPA: MBL fold metallo-hydrolase [Steroidobacteraceae bacterium]|nr:MBL fold metallo-hydrolase [Steroidobacteraceae bacterium]
MVATDLVELAPGVRRLTAPNPGPMTGAGTNTYLLGHDRFVVIDPGPAHEGHVKQILALTKKRIDAVLVTHTHCDHSPGAAPLARASKSALVGRRAPDDGRQDETFDPTCEPEDGEILACEAGTLRAIATPGHASNHVCYLLEEAKVLFTGDHLIAGSTVVILPPDGRMADYLASLRKLQLLEIDRIAPGHGAPIAPAQDEIARIIAHRLARERKVLASLREDGPQPLDQLLPRAYDDVPEQVHVWARQSLLAHLVKLADDGFAEHVEGYGWRRRTAP